MRKEKRRNRETEPTPEQSKAKENGTEEIRQSALIIAEPPRENELKRCLRGLFEFLAGERGAEMLLGQDPQAEPEKARADLATARNTHLGAAPTGAREAAAREHSRERTTERSRPVTRER